MQEENAMRGLSLVLCCGMAAAFVLGALPARAAQDGKNCRMEQQCRWENFKKICVWTKVCR
jgi:hypothetical protein